MFSFKVYDLPCYDGRKSFYGKAKVIEDDKRISLKSYNTIVCYIDKQSKKLGKLFDSYSATTMRHINSFMQSNGYPQYKGKKWWNSLSYGLSMIYNQNVA